MLEADLLAVIPGADSVLSELRTLGDKIPWGDWRGFWLGSLASGRNAVVFFLPLLPVLWLLARRNLRITIVLTGLAFLTFVFGVMYALLWVLMCLIFHKLAERFAIEVKRTDVWPWGPPLAAIGIISAHFLLMNGLNALKLPEAWNAWLLTYAWWLFPLGARGVAWEPHWFGGHTQLFRVMLYQSHNIGAAYLSMRMVTYFAEIKRGTIPIERRSLLNFFAYLCYAPTLIQGPIERYTEFNNEIDTCHERRDWRSLGYGLYRMILGAGKCFGAAVYLYPVLHGSGLDPFANPVMYQSPDKIDGYGLLLFGVHLQVLFLYLVFSGYCDIAIGMSRIIGYRVVENFKRPWMARSLTDMWRRWHISLSFILRDYIFLPLTKKRWNSVATVLVTFFVCGVWHNLSMNYAAWGLLMGLMVWINQRWARWMRNLDRHRDRRLSKVRQAWLRLQPLPKICAWFFTLNVFLMSGWVCFAGFGGAWKVIVELVRRPLAALSSG
ncbi:MAG: MBOAT family O-acyltransferase [Planctomycetota bacterium]